jgi:hypothetical protein
MDFRHANSPVSELQGYRERDFVTPSLVDHPKLLFIPLLIKSLNVTEGGASSDGATKRDKSMNPVNGITQMKVANRNVKMTANNPFRMIPYLRMMNQVPIMQKIVHARVE